jgi:hypothetical protein
LKSKTEFQREKGKKKRRAALLGRVWEEVGYIRGAWGEDHGEKGSIVIRRGIVSLRYFIGMSELPSRSHAACSILLFRYVHIMPCPAFPESPAYPSLSPSPFLQLTHTGLSSPLVPAQSNIYGSGTSNTAAHAAWHVPYAALHARTVAGAVAPSVAPHVKPAAE